MRRRYCLSHAYRTEVLIRIVVVVDAVTMGMLSWFFWHCFGHWKRVLMFAKAGVACQLGVLFRGIWHSIVRAVIANVREAGASYGYSGGGGDHCVGDLALS